MTHICKKLRYLCQFLHVQVFTILLWTLQKTKFIRKPLAGLVDIKSFGTCSSTTCTSPTYYKPTLVHVCFLLEHDNLSFPHQKFICSSSTSCAGFFFFPTYHICYMSLYIVELHNILVVVFENWEWLSLHHTCLIIIFKFYLYKKQVIRK